MAVRLMFFGAERRRLRASDPLPLRRWEPAIIAFLLACGIAGYLLARYRSMSPLAAIVGASVLGILWAAFVTRLAVATARIQPEHDPDDPRYILQGRVGVVITSIPIDGEGMIEYDDGGARRSLRARDIDTQAIAAGQEVCIERVESDVAYVELWAHVERRL